MDFSRYWLKEKHTPETNGFGVYGVICRHDVNRISLFSEPLSTSLASSKKKIMQVCDILAKKKKTKQKHYRDFPGGSVVKNLPFNAGVVSSSPGPGTRIPHAVEQLSLHAAN